MEKFSPHKKEWFLNRVGEMVEREFSLSTPLSVKKSPMLGKINICSEKHAEACFNFHRDNKINFKEAKSVIPERLIKRFEVDLRK